MQYFTEILMKRLQPVYDIRLCIYSRIKQASDKTLARAYIHTHAQVHIYCVIHSLN